MKKRNFKKIMVLAVIVGLILGIVSAMYNLNIYSIMFDIMLVTVLISLVMFIVGLYRILNKNRYYKSLLDDGKYDELIKYMIEKHNRLDGKMGYRQQYILNVASCYSRMGAFKESLDYLAKINEYKMDKNTKAGYYAVYSENLYFLNEDIEKAEELIDKSRQLLDTPNAILLKALISLELGKKEEARQLIDLYYKTTTEKKYIVSITTVLYFDDYNRNISDNFMLGLYFKKIGQEEKAKDYFLKSANCNYKNYFSDKSKELYNS